jgi:hypothetical protein
MPGPLKQGTAWPGEGLFSRKTATVESVNTYVTQTSKHDINLDLDENTLKYN